MYFLQYACPFYQVLPADFEHYHQIFNPDQKKQKATLNRFPICSAILKKNCIQNM